MRGTLIASSIAVILVVAILASAGGYVVVLKNGHKIRCREPMQIQGSNAILTLVTGTVVSYALDQVDIVETERYNKLGLGDALVIEELSLSGTPVPTPTPKLSLGSYASIDASRRIRVGSTTEPTPTPTPGIKLQTVPFHDERIDQAFTKFLDDNNLYLYKTSAGTKSEYYFIRLVTDTEREVFDALKVVAEALVLINRLHPGYHLRRSS